MANTTEKTTVDLKIEKVEFNPTYLTKVTTLGAFKVIINDLFKSVFTDFNECRFTYDHATKALAYNLVFTPGVNLNTNAPITAMVSLEAEAKAGRSSDDLLDRLRSHKQTRSLQAFKLSNEAKDILAKYSFNYNEKVKTNMNWNLRYSEIVNNNNYYRHGYSIQATVVGFDPLTICREMFIEKDDSKQDYILSIIRPIHGLNGSPNYTFQTVNGAYYDNQSPNMQAQELGSAYLIEIKQTSNKAIQQISEDTKYI